MLWASRKKITAKTITKIIFPIPNEGGFSCTGVLFRSVVIRVASPPPVSACHGTAILKIGLFPCRRSNCIAPQAAFRGQLAAPMIRPVSYTHLRAHETDSYLVCRLLLE